MNKTFIFIGRSGCGKGTQAAMLEKYLKKDDSRHGVLYLETGSLFREFIKGDSYAQKLSGELLQNGELQPEFLTVNLWCSFLVEHAKGDQNWIIDGTPRKVIEAEMLNSALFFFKREKPTVLFIRVHRETSEKRLTERHRSDDTKSDIKTRLDWFETDVTKTLDYYKTKPSYKFIEINGDQSIDDVHKEIVQKIEA